MKGLKTRLLSTVTILPLALGVVAGTVVVSDMITAGVTNAVASCKPYNPCAAVAASASDTCFVPRLQSDAACNPCAAKPCSPCAPENPCAAKNPCSPCNPCAAKKPCSPDNPCAAAADVKLTEDEITAVYECLLPEMTEAYGKASLLVTAKWPKWTNMARLSYRSDTHGGRFVANYANHVARGTYRNFDAVKAMPVGSIIAKPSFAVNANGTVAIGPLFAMEKMPAGFNAATADWRYAMVMPDGTLFGITGGKNADGLAYCHDCHAAAEANDMMLFLPEAYRR